MFKTMTLISWIQMNLIEDTTLSFIHQADPFDGAADIARNVINREITAIHLQQSDATLV